MSRMQAWRVDGNQIQNHQKAIHGLLELLWRMQGLIAFIAKGKTKGNKATMHSVQMADDNFSIFAKAEMDKAMWKF